MRKLRVLVMMDDTLIPPASIDGMSDKEIAPFKTEWDVLNCLRAMGHVAEPIGVTKSLDGITRAMKEFGPHICFNLVEEFDGVPFHDQHVVSYLELLKQAYTGCNPRGLTLSRDKALAKKIVSYHGITTPRWAVFAPGREVRRPETLAFPLLVKSCTDEGSQAISQASVVHNDEQLRQRVEFIHEHVWTAAIAEQYIEGRELYVSVLGNRRLQVLPVWELCMDQLPADAPRIATRRVKWDLAYQKRYGIASRAATDLSEETLTRMDELTRTVYRALDLSGYARIDLRMAADGQLYFLEANPNPQIANREDFADSAAAAGMGYEELLQKILSLGLTYRPVGLAA